MASRRDRLMAAQKKNAQKETQENVRKEETLVDIYANSTNENIKNESIPAKIITDDVENAEKITKNDEKIENNLDLTVETEKKLNEQNQENVKSIITESEIKSEVNKTTTNPDENLQEKNTIKELIAIQKKKKLKSNRVGFVLTDQALENLEKYVQITGFKSRNDLVNTLLENLDDFLN